MIEILLLSALVYHAQHDIEHAVSALEEALALAQPGKYVRLFLDEGKPLIDLLHIASAHRRDKTVADYIQTLLTIPNHSSPSQIPAALAEQQVEFPIEALTRRERKVLRLLVAGLSNPEIADELVVSLNTVKTQVRSIYQKLNVKSRQEAIARTRQLKLV